MATKLERTWKHRWLCIRKSDAALFGAASIEDALLAASRSMTPGTREPTGDYRDDPLPDVKEA